MDPIHIRRTKANREALGRTLSALTKEQQEEVLESLETEALSYSDAALRLSAKLGINLGRNGLSAWAAPRLMLRRFARAVSPFSSLDSVSVKQRETLRQGTLLQTQMAIATILAEQKSPTGSAEVLAKLNSILDSSRRTDLAEKAHKLNQDALDLKRIDQKLRQETFDLERRKFEEAEAKLKAARDAMAGIADKGGITPESRQQLEDIFAGGTQ